MKACCKISVKSEGIIYHPAILDACVLYILRSCRCSKFNRAQGSSDRLANEKKGDSVS